MNKKQVGQDIVPNNRRSIRDIPLSSREKKTKKTEKKVLVETPVYSEEKYSNFNVFEEGESNNPRWGKVILWILIIFVLLGGVVYAFSFFNSAVVNLKIKEVSSPVDVEINMSKTAASSSLAFEIVSLDTEASQGVRAQGEKQVSEKASGTIVVYNKNTIAQKLLAQTRFQSAGGKIYRIEKTVTIPAGKKVGQNITPGSIETGIVADIPGAESNSPLTDFTLPAFKGTAKYTSVYARSKTVISGGAQGTVKIAKPEDVATAKNSLDSSIKDQLLKNVNSQKPDNFILLDNSYSIKYTPEDQESKGDSILVKEKGSIVGVLVDSNSFASYLAYQVIKGYAGEDIKIVNLNELTFSPTTATSSLSANTSQFSVGVKGTAHFVYKYNADQLKKDLLGMSRASFPTIVATYTGIEKADAIIKPFWISRFPAQTDKIIVIEE